MWPLMSISLEIVTEYEPPSPPMERLEEAKALEKKILSVEGVESAKAGIPFTRAFGIPDELIANTVVHLANYAIPGLAIVLREWLKQRGCRSVEIKRGRSSLKIPADKAEGLKDLIDRFMSETSEKSQEPRKKDR